MTAPETIEGHGSEAPWQDHEYPIRWRDATGAGHAAWGGQRGQVAAAGWNQHDRQQQGAIAQGIGYALQMALRPQTLYGIADSPVGVFLPISFRIVRRAGARTNGAHRFRGAVAAAGRRPGAAPCADAEGSRSRGRG